MESSKNRYQTGKIVEIACLYTNWILFVPFNVKVLESEEVIVPSSLMPLIRKIVTNL